VACSSHYSLWHQPYVLLLLQVFHWTVWLDRLEGLLLVPDLLVLKIWCARCCCCRCFTGLCGLHLEALQSLLAAWLLS
jgi:hypothetical protein